MKLTNIQTLFATKGITDTKKKINRLNKKISPEILDKIENGITSEDIADLKKSGVPIFMYGTQITIHGIFDTLAVNYIYGYKNVFQNKNKSIGIKYNAIDEEKRKRIAKRLEAIGISYFRNSTETSFYISIRTNKQNFKKDVENLKKIYDKIDESLFYGGKSLKYGYYMMSLYIILEIHIGAIYEKNIETFLNKLGATKEVCEKYEAEKRAKMEKLEAEWKAEREKAQKLAEEKADEILRENADLLKYFENKKEVKRTRENGIYIGYNIRDGKLIFYKTHIRGKKLKYKKVFASENFDEVLQYQFADNKGYKRDNDIIKVTATGYIFEKETPKQNEIIPVIANKQANISIVDYSQKAIAVFGDTKKIKDILKQAGGRFNPRLKGGAGWIFPKTKKEQLQKLLAI